MSKELLRWDIPSSGMFRSVDWQLVADVMGQHILQVWSGSPAWSLKMKSICCPETSLTNYQSTLRKIPEKEKISFAPRRKPSVNCNIIMEAAFN